MTTITKEEYSQQLKEYSRQQWEKAEVKPNGMFSTWGWHLRVQREFRQKLIEQNITVEGIDLTKP